MQPSLCRGDKPHLHTWGGNGVRCTTTHCSLPPQGSPGHPNQGPPPTCHALPRGDTCWGAALGWRSMLGVG